MSIYKKGVILLSSLMVLVLCVTGIRAWYVSGNDDAMDGTMGTLDAQVENKSSNLRTFASSTNSLNKDFVIKNKSNIDSFVRISYTVVFKDSKNKEVLADSSNINLNSVTLSSNNTKLSHIESDILNASGYTKKFIVPVSSGSKYYRVAPNQDINGSISLSVETLDGLRPEIIISSETIQATEKALKEASSYGWNVSNF